MSCYGSWKFSEMEIRKWEVSDSKMHAKSCMPNHACQGLLNYRWWRLKKKGFNGPIRIGCPKLISALNPIQFTIQFLTLWTYLYFWIQQPPWVGIARSESANACPDLHSRHYNDPTPVPVTCSMRVPDAPVLCCESNFQMFTVIFYVYLLSHCDHTWNITDLRSFDFILFYMYSVENRDTILYTGQAGRIYHIFLHRSI